MSRYYTATYKCGHEGEVFLRGTPSKNRETLEWLRTKICPKCSRAEEYAIESEQAAKEAKEKGLPELEGSEKQIKWAESLRRKALTSPINNFDRKLLKSKNQKIKMIAQVCARAREKLETETSSRWWIDHRDELEDYCRLQAMKAPELKAFSEN